MYSLMLEKARAGFPDILHKVKKKSSFLKLDVYIGWPELGAEEEERPSGEEDAGVPTPRRKQVVEGVPTPRRKQVVEGVTTSCRQQVVEGVPTFCR